MRLSVYRVSVRHTLFIRRRDMQDIVRGISHLRSIRTRSVVREGHRSIISELSELSAVDRSLRYRDSRGLHVSDDESAVSPRLVPAPGLKYCGRVSHTYSR